MRGCAGSRVGPGSSCSHLAPLGASQAPVFCRECYVWSQVNTGKRKVEFVFSFMKVIE